MKKFLIIAIAIILALSINLKAAIKKDILPNIEMPCIEQLDSQLRSVIPNEHARDVLRSYYSSFVKLQSQELNKEQIEQNISQLAINTARDILSYGVNIQALKTLIQDPKWNVFFGVLLTKYQQLTQPEQTSSFRTTQYSHATTRWLKYTDPMYFVKSILPVMEVLLVVLVIVHMIENIPAAQAYSGKEIQCALHRAIQGCPCDEFEQSCKQPREGCILLAIHCLLHQLSIFFAGYTCPCSD